MGELHGQKRVGVAMVDAVVPTVEAPDRIRHGAGSWARLRSRRHCRAVRVVGRLGHWGVLRGRILSLGGRWVVGLLAAGGLRRSGRRGILLLLRLLLLRLLLAILGLLGRS